MPLRRANTVRALIATAALAGVLGAMLFYASGARAQGMAAQNYAFDQQQAAMLANLQRRNADAQQQLWQNHLRVNGPRLQRQYRQLVASGQAVGTYEQFAYWDLMTAGGTNVQGGLDAQRRQFEGSQAANRTVQEGHASYNAAMADNSRRQSAAVENYGNQAIRGVGPYVDPRTGATLMLPHYLPQGQVVRDAQNNAYAQDAQGNYHRWDGYNWVPLTPGR